MATKPDQNHDAQVLIVGGGPVGMGLAIELGQRGISVAVVERHQTPQPIPKGQNLTQRTGEHFRHWGISQEIRAAAPIPHDFGSAGMTAYGALLSGYTYDWYRRGEVRRYYFADNERLPQYCTEAVLRARVKQLENVTLHYGGTAMDLGQDDAGVWVDIASPGRADQHRLTAQYMVGCDGSGSKVRQRTGIKQDVQAHHRKMVLLVIRSHALHRLLEPFGAKSYFNVINPKLQGYWQFLGRVDLDGRWFFHAPVPKNTTLENFDFAALMHGVIGAEFDLDFEHIGFWDLRFATAKTYRRNRIFIAGDAAHSHPPYGGYGINTGFEDARNLGWKLAAMLGGWGNDRLLDSYDAERRPVFAATAKHFIARLIEDDRQFIATHNPAKDCAGFEAAWDARARGGNADVTAFAPHYVGSPIVAGGGDGPPGAVGDHSFTARPGQHLPPHQLPDGVDLFTALADGFALISMRGDRQVAREFTDAAAHLGVALTVVEQNDKSIENQYGARYILVRPDHFVAWVGTQAPADAAAIIAYAISSGPASSSNRSE